MNIYPFYNLAAYDAELLPSMQYSSPIYEPKRPHPKQSYRSQQRAAKKRRNR